MYKSMSYFSRFVFLLLTVVSLSAHAHKIRISVYVEGVKVEGEVYFVGGANPVGTGLDVELIKGEAVVRTVRSDDEGWFDFGDVTPDTYTVRADAGQGHVAFYELEKREFPDAEPVAQVQTNEISEAVTNEDLCSSFSSQELQSAIAKAVRPLREQIDRYEAKTRLHDILGGIGYILGLFGLLVLVRGRKS